MSTLALRLRVQAYGFTCVPCVGKRPAVSDWQSLRTSDGSTMARWPGANTGILTRNAPTLDIDITDPEVATALEEAIREWFDERGKILVRFGRTPRRAIHFRTDTPFPKMTAAFTDPAGRSQKIELLCDGQQVVINGVHPDTLEPYTYAGDYTPSNTPREELPELDAHEALELFEHLIKLVTGAYDYTRTEGLGAADAPPSQRRGPLDVAAMLDQMRHCGGVQGVHETQLRCSASLLNSGVSVDVTTEMLLEATRAAVAEDDRSVTWNWDLEERGVRRMCYDLIRKNHNLSYLLPDRWRSDFEARVEAGLDPRITYNRYGWCIHPKDLTPKLHVVGGTDIEASVLTDDLVEEPLGAAEEKEPQSSIPPLPAGWVVYDADDIRPPSWIIKNLLPESGVLILPGQWGSYKTTAVLDLSHAIMTGTAFAGAYKVKKQGAVMLYALEGSPGINLRMRAVDNFKGGGGPRLPLFKRDNITTLLASPGAAATILKDVKQTQAHSQAAYGMPVVVLWIDTYSAAAGHGTSGDDNDRAATQKIFNTLRAIAREAGILVAVVDHFGKLAEAGTTGSSGKEGNADAVLANLGDRALSGDITNLRMAVRKQRDGKAFFEIPFKVETVQLGTDDDGDPIEACAIDWGTARAAQRKTPLNENDALLLKALGEVLDAHGFDVITEDGELVTGCHEEALKEVFYEMMPRGEGTDQQVRQRRAMNFERAMKRALAHGRVALRSGEAGAVVHRT